MVVCDKSSTFKAFEDYQMITDTTSSAYRYIQKNMVVCNDGFLRTKDGEYIGIAISKRYGTIGDKFKIKFSSGAELKCVVIDIKSDRHLKNACTDSNGGMIEFVVETDLIPSEAWTSGSFDFAFHGTIERIYKKKGK